MPGAKTELTLTGGFNPKRIIIGNPTFVRWDKLSATPSVTFRDNLFCERYVKNDKGEMIAIDNIDVCAAIRRSLKANLDRDQIYTALSEEFRASGLDDQEAGIVAELVNDESCLWK